MLAAILLLAAAAIPPAAAAGRPHLLVQMEVDAAVTLDRADLKTIALDVRRIWSPIVDIVVSTPFERSAPIAVDAVRVLITTRTLDARENTGLGWIAFVDSRPRPEITVSTTAARRLMERGRWMGRSMASLPPAAARVFVQRTLARAIAHEVGHYLLGSPRHDRRGLMRARFTADEMMDRGDTFDRIDPASAARIRRAPELARMRTN
jgi:hypothetical protein